MRKRKNQRASRLPRSAFRVGFIGFGRMGSALAQGAVDSKIIRASQGVAFDPALQAQRHMRRLKFQPQAGSAAVVDRADIIFLCVKPQMMGASLGEIRREVPFSRLRRKCFVSIAAGVTLHQLENGLGEGIPVIRVMPNTPALLKAGMAVMSRGHFAKSVHESPVRRILRSVGEVLSLDEKWMDVITALSGSGPAYVFYLAESLMKAGRKLGLKEDLARVMVRQTLFGAGLMLKERPESARDLRAQVTSPGGTTAAAIAAFDERGLSDIVLEALERAARRSRELSSQIQ